MNIKQITNQVDSIFRNITGGEDLPNAKNAILAIMADMVKASQTKLVKYIGHRETHKDTLYGTDLVWKNGETLPVPLKAASKMLNHIDVYAEGKRASRKLTIEEVLPKDENKTIESDKDQEARDAVSRMDSVDMVRSFVHDNFAGNKLSNSIKSIDTARAKAVSLIDRLGMG